MRFIQLLLLLALAISSACLPVQAAEKSTPDNLEPLAEALPPPPALEGNPADEPEVTIVKKGENTVEEYRVHGELYMQKITPSHGVPYYLIKEDQNGAWSRFDGPAAPLVIPKWVIFRF
ncbi:MAG: DUF2782 domain-containing protein [Alphaproteobacteria bacterium]|mgnify:CR=1 FL=1|nr:DUF2782 domain-containing protein [Methylophilaceae bacterium]NBQ39141.1 DUF2782 domain-containing protein [Alphaproteobacteria bacterium]NCA26697.1 DUF2782 domain-containing protein [Methylophilaceae bacterium]